MNVIEYVHDRYDFLLQRGFNIQVYGGSSAVSNSLSLYSQEENIVFYFIYEYDILSVQIGISEYVGDDEGAYDFFYIEKYLYPEKKFSEIFPSDYPSIIRDNYNSIVMLFDKNNIKDTIKALNKIMKDYDRVRWKGDL
jgi:hypothetical protein